MKNHYLFLIILTLALSTSCTKIGCTDPFAENYSIHANRDDASCIYKKSTIISIDEWTNYETYFGATIYWDELTSDVISNSVVQVSVGGDSEGWTQLPLTFPQDGTYSTTIEVVLSVGRVDLTWIDSDLLVFESPGRRNFKIIIN